MGTPSTTYSGWLLLDSEDSPRMTTRVDEPAPEFPDIICTPETFPASLLRTLASLLHSCYHLLQLAGHIQVIFSLF